MQIGSTVIMQTPQETKTPSEAASKHPFQVNIHAPQPVNLAAVRGVQAFLDLYGTSIDDGPIPRRHDAPQTGTSSMDLRSGILSTANQETPSRNVFKSQNSPEIPPNPYPGTIIQDTTNANFQEEKPPEPERVTFWPVLERYLDYPTLPCPQPWCSVCCNEMLVLGLDQVPKEDPAIDYEKCIVLLCGHLIGSRCFDDLISKHFESLEAEEWQLHEHREDWFDPATCPICRMSLSCRRCGLIHKRAILPASIGDGWEDVSLILLGPPGAPEFCEDCAAHLGF